MCAGGFRRAKTTGEWIREYLEDAEEAYVGELHQAFKQWCIDHEYNPPRYDSFRRTVWLLTQLDLLEPTRTKPGENPALADRQYYRIDPRSDRADPGWRDPVREMYGRNNSQ